MRRGKSEVGYGTLREDIRKSQNHSLSGSTLMRTIYPLQRKTPQRHLKLILIVRIGAV